MVEDTKLLQLLDIVIDNYIRKGDPVGSKFLHSLEDVSYAPSTLRKYLNVLEKEWMVFQPYNSSWRIPTVKGLSTYLAHYLEDARQEEAEEGEIEVKSARQWLKYFVETLGKVVDGVVVWFLRNDEYYYLWINNLLRDDLAGEYENTRYIVRFIENKWIVKYLDGKMIKRNQVYYTFVQDEDSILSCLYAKIVINEYDCILSIIWPTRVDYKKNVKIMRKIIKSLGW